MYKDNSRERHRILKYYILNADVLTFVKISVFRKGR